MNETMTVWYFIDQDWYVWAFWTEHMCRAASALVSGGECMRVSGA